MLKKLIYKIILVILIIAAIITGGIIINKFSTDYKYDEENKEIVNQFYQIKDNDNEQYNVNNITETKESRIDLKFMGYRVIGIIKIPKINLEYPILEKTTKSTMNTSISRFYGGEINSFGNVSLAGHNNYSGTMFGKNHKLNKDDLIYLTDTTSKTIEYKIFEIFTTDPNDTSILETIDKNIREVTLITCKNGRSERLIIKARENI